MKHKHFQLFLTLIFFSLVLPVTGCGKSKGKTVTDEPTVQQTQTDSQTGEQSSHHTDEAISEKTTPSSESSITPAMWKITDPDGHQIYMMGSIHMADESAEVFPEYFEKIYRNCDSLAVECDITDMGTNIISLSRKMMYTDGTTIKDHVRKESYDTVVAVFKEAEQYSPSYDYMKPIIWVTLVESIAAGQSGLSEEYGIDSQLIKRAKNDGKEILEVESVDFQMNLLFNLPDELQSLLFDDIAQDDILNEYVTDLTELYDNWKKGTITEEILGETDETTDHSDDPSLTEEEQALLEDYNRAMLYDRNIGMKDAALSYMKDGKNVLFVVGAAHFYGEKGILALLEEAGCTVETISPTTSQESPQETQQKAA